MVSLFIPTLRRFNPHSDASLGCASTQSGERELSSRRSDGHNQYNLCSEDLACFQRRLSLPSDAFASSQTAERHTDEPGGQRSRGHGVARIAVPHRPDVAGRAAVRPVVRAWHQRHSTSRIHTEVDPCHRRRTVGAGQSLGRPLCHSLPLLCRRGSPGHPFEIGGMRPRAQLPLVRGPTGTDPASLERYELDIRRSILRKIRQAPNSRLARAIRRLLHLEPAEAASSSLHAGRRTPLALARVVRHAPRRLRAHRHPRRRTQAKSTADPPPGPASPPSARSNANRHHRRHESSIRSVEYGFYSKPVTDCAVVLARAFRATLPSCKRERPEDSPGIQAKGGAP